MFWPKDLANGTTQSQIRGTHSAEILCGCRRRRIKTRRRMWCCSLIRIILESGLSIVRITSLHLTSSPLLHLLLLYLCLPLRPPLSLPLVFLTILLLHPFSLLNIPLTFFHHRSHSLARIRRPLRQHPRTPRRHSQKHEDPRCNGAEL